MIEKLKSKVENANFYQFTGFVNQVIGLTIESQGPAVSIGTLCRIKAAKTETLAEVVGFKENKVLLMPYSDLVGVFPGCKVIAQDSIFEVKVGKELLGRILDGLGQPIDGKGEIKSKIKYPVENSAKPARKTQDRHHNAAWNKGYRHSFDHWQGTESWHICRKRRWQKYPSWHDCPKCKGGCKCSCVDW